MSRRILLAVSYDGTGYHGFAAQEGVKTVEGCLNEAVSLLEGRQVLVIGASRTDAGVHAKKNLAVFDTELRMSAEKYRFALNVRLPEDIRIRSSVEVPGDFHPRKIRTVKTYCYRIINTSDPDPMQRLYAEFVSWPLDEKRMGKAAEFLLGEHDFKSFCSVHTQAESTVREITEAFVERKGEEVLITVRGYGFLYNMVRIIAGTLIEVGRGAMEPERVREILEGCDRCLAGPTAPAKGLTLYDIRVCSQTVNPC